MGRKSVHKMHSQMTIQKRNGTNDTTLFAYKTILTTNVYLRVAISPETHLWTCDFTRYLLKGLAISPEHYLTISFVRVSLLRRLVISPQNT